MVTYKYNIYKSKNVKYIDKILCECCFVWNHALTLQKRYYRLYGKYISYVRMSGHFTKRIKRNIINSQTRQEILQRLDESYKRFFKKIAKRPPKIKKLQNISSFIFRGSGYILSGNVFIINKVKKCLKFSYSREYKGKIKQIRIKRLKCGRYELHIITDHSMNNTYRKTHNGASVGIDFGLKTYMTLNNGTTYQSPRFFKQHENKVSLTKRRLYRAKLYSNNRKRRSFEFNQVHRRIKNKRDDYQWKLAHELCKKYDYIFIETLDMDEMRRYWGKKVSDLSHSNFVNKLIHVALKYNVVVHKIDRWYPSSKTCKCGYVNKKLSLKDRSWTCPECGSINDRDLNAAQNILRRGIYELESKCKTSC